MEEPIILILNSLNGVKFSTVNLNSLKSLAFGFVTSLSLFGVLVSGLPLLSGAVQDFSIRTNVSILQGKE